MPYPVCLKCKLFYKPHKVGVSFVEGKPVGVTGNQHWVPYKLWRADIYKCHGCDDEILTGMGLEPARIDYQPDFKDIVAKSDVVAFVQDC